MSAYPKGSTVLVRRRELCLAFLTKGGGTAGQLRAQISRDNPDEPWVAYEHSLGSLSTMFRKLERESLAYRDGCRPGYTEIIWRASTLAFQPLPKDEPMSDESQHASDRRAERRMAALAAAATFHAGRTAIDPEHVVAAAVQFEHYLLTGQQAPEATPDPVPPVSG